MSQYDILVNKQHLLSPDDIPTSLTEAQIPFDAPPGDPKCLLDSQTAESVMELFAFAENAGIYLYGISGYRSYFRQMELYDPLKNTLYVAPPGGSEHQTGLALDVSCVSVGLDLIEEFAQTPEGIWLAKNAHLFGFIIRYPQSKEDITGYAYEPWHIRYVTKPLALYLALTGLTLEEYHYQASFIPSGISKLS